MTKSRIAGALRARGVLGGEVQKIIRKHCENGNSQEMIEAVAEAMLAVGISSGRVPPNAGIKTKDLLDRTEAALIKEVEDYHARGGVLTAKGYVSVQGLTAEMAKQWITGFSAPIPETFSIAGTLSDPEIQDRLTLVTLRLRELIMEKVVPLDSVTTGAVVDGKYLFVEKDRLEGICRQAAVDMFRAFTKPNETNHELIHGEKV